MKASGKEKLWMNGDTGKAFDYGKRLAERVARTSIPSSLEEYPNMLKAREEAFVWVLEEAGIQSDGFEGFITPELGRNFDSGLEKGFDKVWKEKVGTRLRVKGKRM